MGDKTSFYQQQKQKGRKYGRLWNGPVDWLVTELTGKRSIFSWGKEFGLAWFPKLGEGQRNKVNQGAISGDWIFYIPGGFSGFWEIG